MHARAGMTKNDFFTFLLGHHHHQPTNFADTPFFFVFCLILEKKKNAMSIETTGLDDDNEKKHCYWASDQIMELDKAVKNVITVRCENFRNELLSLSKLKSGSTFYMLLQEVLVRFLQFEKETSREHRCCKKTKDEKLHAVVAGSYPAFLANAIKQHGDVEVFVMVKDDSTMKVFNAVWKFLRQEADDNGE